MVIAYHGGEETPYGLHGNISVVGSVFNLRFTL